MSNNESEVKSDSTNPFNQAGITSLLIGLSTIFIQDTAWRSGIALIAPFVSYGCIYGFTSYRRGQKLKKALLAIDNTIARLKTINQDPDLPPAEKDENEKEILRLNQLRTNTELQQYDIK